MLRVHRLSPHDRCRVCDAPRMLRRLWNRVWCPGGAELLCDPCCDWSDRLLCIRSLFETTAC